jgi:tetratricopeptide (TPR) repeat protein
MLILRTLLVSLSFALSGAASGAFAQDLTLQPKYGGQAKNDAQKAADEKFMASIDGHYKGDRKKAADDIATRGWQFLRQGNAPDAMRRFNQAWLLDGSNGSALWGMAAFEAGSGRLNESLTLFAEADRVIGGDVDFSADYAKALGIAGVQTRNESMLKDAFTRFARVHEKAPQHTLNLQNWAITLFYAGNFSEAWKKVKLAEATPRRADLDPRFVAALESKMPRP